MTSTWASLSLFILSSSVLTNSLLFSALSDPRPNLRGTFSRKLPAYSLPPDLLSVQLYTGKDFWTKPTPSPWPAPGPTYHSLFTLCLLLSPCQLPLILSFLRLRGTFARARPGYSRSPARSTFWPTVQAQIFTYHTTNTPLGQALGLWNDTFMCKAWSPVPLHPVLLPLDLSSLPTSKATWKVLSSKKENGSMVVLLILLLSSLVMMMASFWSGSGFYPFIIRVLKVPETNNGIHPANLVYWQHSLFVCFHTRLVSALSLLMLTAYT